MRPVRDEIGAHAYQAVAPLCILCAALVFSLTAPDFVTWGNLEPVRN